MSADSSLPADQAVREEALDPTRSFIVEAPAGSGKTELLTRRFLRLLACVREPEEILAITFTRKAAAEMRNRVLQALESAEGKPPEKPAKRAMWELARAVADVDAQFDWQLRAHPARLRILTIDALNNLLARQLPILSGIGATLRITADTEKLYAEAVLRLLERLGTRSDEAAAIARLLRHLDNRYDVLEQLLSKELNRREYWLDLGLMRFDLPELRKRLELALQTAICQELSALRTFVPRDARDEMVALAVHAASVLNGQGIDHPLAACDALDDIPGVTLSSVVQWRGLAEMLLTEKGAWRKEPNKNQGFPPHYKAEKQRVKELLGRLQPDSDFAAALDRVRTLPSANYGDAQWQVLTDLFDVLKLAIVELEVVMRERGEGDYTAIAIAARRALGSIDEPTDLALRLDYRVQHILVDEFQDTSRGQTELLSLLTAGWTEGDGRTLFCVGDPMQSIYRFRHADVGLFLHLKTAGLNQLHLKPLRLTVNFRSAKPVMNWVNAAFASSLPSRDDPHRGAVAFTASQAHAAAENVGGVVVHPILGKRLDARDAEAKQICALIEQTRASQPDAKIAVLAVNRLHLQRVIRELRDKGVSFNAVEIDPLITRPAIQDVVALTRALVHLADRTAWLAILRAPWCGLSLADLHALCGEGSADGLGDDAANETVWQLLNTEIRIGALSAEGRRRVERVSAILRQALSFRGRLSLRECIERTWNALGGPGTVESPSALLDCEAYFLRLERIERAGDLEDSALLEEALRDLFASDINAQDSKVELMTVHRAKGLEFDVVILPGLDSGSKHEEPPLLRTLDLQASNERMLLLAPIAARGGDDDPIYAWLEKQDKERARLEKGRLLYVAATRAIRELHLFGATEAGGKPRANTALQALWPSVEAEFNAAGAFAAPQGMEPSVLSRTIRTRRLPETWALPAPNEHIGQLTLRNVVDGELIHPEFAWVGETARHVGTVVHRELERLGRSGNLSMSDTSADQARYRIALAELGVPPYLRDYAAKRIDQALNAIVSDERGRWLLEGTGSHRDAASEFAISGTIGGEIVNGVIDRTFVDRDGIRWIVDFKTSTHEGGGIDEFLSSEVLRYQAQLKRYAILMRALHPAEPIRAALYFPLLGAWREVAVF